MSGGANFSLRTWAAHARVEDELDVFEAASYYSGISDAADTNYYCGPAVKEGRRAAGRTGDRRSVDVAMLREPAAAAHRPDLHYSQYKGGKATKEKKSKQPSSPGGRLASFLNSFFHQGSSKKKPESAAMTGTVPCKDGDGGAGHGGRWKRRGSVSRAQAAYCDSSSSFSYSSSCGLRTPSLAVTEDVHRSAPPPSCPSSEAFNEGRPSYCDLSWERSRRASMNGSSFGRGRCSYYGWSVVYEGDGGAPYLGEKKWVLQKADANKGACATVRSELLRADHLLAAPPQRNNMWRKEEEVDDGGESDSSSDLFDLPSCNLAVHLAGSLPVYETTSMEGIKHGSSAVDEITI